MFSDINECIQWIESQKRRKREKNLDDFKALCDFFGNPQDQFKSIHVAGTNGKGSVVSYLAQILRCAKYNVGTFTSPYIDCFNERIQYNHHYIPDSYLLKYVNFITSKYEELDKLNIERPSFFALITLIAFMFFKDVKVDVAIIECGIGGLLDDTNVINPILSIITNVAYDHMDVLGNSIYDIAKNKLGIVKHNVPLVTIQNDQIKDLIKEKCYQEYSQYTIVKKKNITNVRLGLGVSMFNYLEYTDVKLHMSGAYQAENASIAIEAMRYLVNMGFNVSKKDIYAGLYKTFWLARLEFLSKSPIIIIDGAHNVDAITRLMEYLESIKKQRYIRLILAISSNKDIDKMLSLINENVIDELILSEFSYKRSSDSLSLYERANHKNKKLINNLEDAFKIVFEDNNDVINVFSGSLYFVSEVRKLYLDKYNNN